MEANERLDRLGYVRRLGKDERNRERPVGMQVRRGELPQVLPFEMLVDGAAYRVGRTAEGERVHTYSHQKHRGDSQPGHHLAQSLRLESSTAGIHVVPGNYNQPSP